MAASSLTGVGEVMTIIFINNCFAARDLYYLFSWLIFSLSFLLARMEQKCSPHMEQKCASLWPSSGRVSSWNFITFSESSAR